MFCINTKEFYVKQVGTCIRNKIKGRKLLAQSKNVVKLFISKTLVYKYSSKFGKTMLEFWFADQLGNDDILLLIFLRNTL